jgi:hypothetical protein
LEYRIMPTATVTALPQSKATAKKKSAKASRKPALSERMGRKLRLQRGAALGIAAVATGITAVSLSHIAAFAIHYGHVAEWQSWALAAGIDLNYTGMEFAGVVAAYQHVRERLHGWTRWAVPTIATFSAICNMLEFARDASNSFEIVAACVMGAIVPGLVYVSYRVAAVMADV